jgi:hypothetical protein
LLVVSKYNAPSSNGSPSLSTLGLDAFAPKYASSKLSAYASAALALLAAAVALLEALVALVLALLADVAALLSEVAALLSDEAAADALLAEAVALFAELVALVAAALALVVADAASTNKSHFALSVFVVNGNEPDDVCAVFAINMLFVVVSFTISLALYDVLAAQFPCMFLILV